MYRLKNLKKALAKGSRPVRIHLARVLTVFASLALIANVRGDSADKVTKVEEFHLEGVAIWECQCPAYGCPCQKNGLPSEAMCHASDFSHIERGHYGNIKLDGLNLVLVGNLVDAMADRLFATLYLDERATHEQSDALFQIVQYMNTLANQPPVPFRRVKGVPIAFYESGDRTEYRVDIANTLHEKALLRRGKSGNPLFTMPAMDLWSNTVHNVDNVEFKYGDAEAGESWDYSGHYANLKYFSVSKQMYVQEKMLGQHGDNSGKWTPKQLEIIRQQGLEKKKKRSLLRVINQSVHSAGHQLFNKVSAGLLQPWGLVPIRRLPWQRSRFCREQS